MDKYSIKNMKRLIEELNHYTQLYDEGVPAISDEEWDKMYFELKDIENVFGFTYPNSPTQKISFELVNELKKVEHSHPMLSLDKTKNIEDIKSFIALHEYIVMPKLDGLTCSLTYKNGKLVQAETRGNGIIGEDILHNALHVKNIPNQINCPTDLIVDGEIICTYSDFEPFKDKYKNPRNFAAGSIRLLNSKESESRNLSFMVWDGIFKEEPETLSKKLDLLDTLGFDVVPYFVDRHRPNLESYINGLRDICSDYPIDGMVIKYNNCEEYNAEGRTDHHFKGGMAYKFYDDEYETILRDIEWTMGRTGQLTPVAVFDSIDIDGSEVSKASLHNISVLRSTLHSTGWYGQKVYVAKMNMIIPQIVKAESYNGEGKSYFYIPTKCPICGEPTEQKQDYDSNILYCGNPNCPGKKLNRLDHFCSKKGLDIKGLSKATLEKLMDWGWIEDYYDIFTLNNYAEEWMHISGFGPASVHNILAAIDEARETTLDKIIAAAGIPEIGSRVSKDLSRYYDSYADFRAETNFLKYDGIGEIMQNNLLNFDYNDLRFDETVKTFLKIKEKEENNNENKLENKVFCITGKTHIFKNRADLTADIESKGGKVVSSMSSKVHYLINNDATSSSTKNKAAKSAGIPILTEEDYLAL